MEETIVQVSDDVQFIEGTTKMDQENWQKYFGSVLENRILSGFEISVENALDNDTVKITSGSVIANGVVGHIDFDGGYIEEAIGKPSDSFRDVFYCVRLYFTGNRVELIKKTNVVESRAYYTDVINSLMLDESYLCDRSDLYYEFPIAYVKDQLYAASGALHSFNAISLRDRYNKSRLYSNSIPLGGHVYGNGVIFDDYLGGPNDQSEQICIDYLDQVEDLYIYTSYTGGTIYIQNIPWLNLSDNGTYHNTSAADYALLKKYVFHLKGTHLSQNTKEVTYANPNSSGIKGIHIQKLYNYSSSAQDSLAHYQITEV